MYAWHIISAIFSSTFQKLLKLVEIRQSSDRNNFAQFFLRHRVLSIHSIVNIYIYIAFLHLAKGCLLECKCC